MRAQTTEPPLDLLSTSATQINQRCIFGAPLIAMIFNGHATIQQACCNHWECPHCGVIRARQEYHKITWGAEVLADEGHDLYFWTLTCRGREISYDEAMAHYYEWTHRIITNASTKARRAGLFWCYVQVTEHQRKTRNHPHSHLLTTFLPSDAVETHDADGKPAFISEWFTAANRTCGLGAQHRISRVASPAAVSGYVAKYLFKDSILAEWPRKWKRVRYSRNWPTPPYRTADLCIVLSKPNAWADADALGIEFTAEDDLRYEQAIHHIANVRRNHWQDGKDF